MLESNVNHVNQTARRNWAMRYRLKFVGIIAISIMVLLATFTVVGLWFSSSMLLSPSFKVGVYGHAQCRELIETV